LVRGRIALPSFTRRGLGEVERGGVGGGGGVGLGMRAYSLLLFKGNGIIKLEFIFLTKTYAGTAGSGNNKK